MSDLLGRDTVEIERGYTNYEGEPVDAITFDRGWYAIYPGKCKHDAIVSREYDGFLVEVSKWIPGTFWEPDDVDVRLDCVAVTFMGALNFVMHQLMGDRVDRYFESTLWDQQIEDDYGCDL